jgi:hypothetical protein
MNETVHEKIHELLDNEDPTLKLFLLKVIELAQTSRLSADSLVPRVQRILDQLAKEDYNANSEH